MKSRGTPGFELVAVDNAFGETEIETCVEKKDHINYLMVSNEIKTKKGTIGKLFGWLKTKRNNGFQFNY